ncbi:ChaN family lipoprotein [Ramlibacter tataouinensis]|uniref:CjrA protein-like protein n=1 Tax=Ramlibacter tataouinensis (strain ATCC BAA-407 / DSM 14655 / LMG 21543 / TTB310) TaxID=365046 RepID=F5Y1I9_RAMTT|nr:ChaN family lipoprotein [Ramlibacter tataouinensis]AEG94773.1 CjrA protein-like protein [Ramlibacter tataouinensis TTB310]
MSLSLSLRRLAAVLVLPLAAAACASLPPPVAQALPADVLLLGEQHDVAAHQERHRETVAGLAAQGRLAALALEMAEVGRSTAGLQRDASEAAVREALRWNDEGWPWQAYGPAVMAAVRAGVPVLGANLPRKDMRGAMVDAGLDGRLPEAELAAQRQAIRDGHCGLLPQAQIAPMARIQIARDIAMARTLAQAARPGRTVVLLAGSGHVDEQLGVPRHLPSALRWRAIRWPADPGQPARDYCAQLREQMPPRR